MIQTEYVRNLNCNYERVLLDQQPEENRYQYCIVGRGGIRRLLPCSLRYINGMAYLYYDVSSTQNIAQLYLNKSIGREWIRDFLWNMKKVQLELNRFLLEDRNLIWYPEHIFQDLEKKDFCFMYIPYYEGDNGFQKLLDYFVEHIDYEDEGLVDCVYTFYEKYAMAGEEYIKGPIFEDAEKLAEQLPEEQVREKTEGLTEGKRENIAAQREAPARKKELAEPAADILEEKQRKGILYFLEGRRKRQKEERKNVQNKLQGLMDPYNAYGVAEDSTYHAEIRDQAEPEEEEELGKTLYMEEQEEERKVHRLYAADGKTVFVLEKPTALIGKKREEADCILNDASVSRLHARITKEGEDFYLEDLNSTNGTFKNGLRLQPYEKRKLQEEDEIRLGKITLIFR